MGELGIRPGVSARRIHLLVPGTIARRTGGTLYAARLLAELRAMGREVHLHELPGRFPLPDAQAHVAARGAIAAAAPGDVVLVDGLALAALDPGAASRSVLLYHMPAAEESGRTAAERTRLTQIEEAWLRRAARIVATSAYVAERLVRRGYPRERIAMVEPGTDRVPPRPLRADPDTIELLSVGSITHVKGHRFLVRALAGLAQLPWSLTLVGNTSAEPHTHRALMEEIERLGLRGRVRLTGELPPEGVRAAHRAADLFVLPSLFESYGMALAEAAAHGVPLIATCAGAIPTTPAGAAALRVPPGDDASLARALREVLSSPDLRSRLAAASRAAAGRLPSWGEQARRFAAEVDAAAPGE